MYVRIARFEGAEGNWDERISEIREGMAAGMAAADGPPIKRALMLVDRENGRGAAVAFCETEDDLRKVDDFVGQSVAARRFGCSLFGGAVRGGGRLREALVGAARVANGIVSARNRRAFRGDEHVGEPQGQPPGPVRPHHSEAQPEMADAAGKRQHMLTVGGQAIRRPWRLKRRRHPLGSMFSLPAPDQPPHELEQGAVQTAARSHRM